jgi:hypothetical protein
MEKPKPPTTTEDDLLALLGSLALDEAGLSVTEMVERTGKTCGTIRGQLRPLWKSGRLVVGRKRMPCMDGTTRLVPVYRLKT